MRRRAVPAVLPLLLAALAAACGPSGSGPADASQQGDGAVGNDAARDAAVDVAQDDAAPADAADDAAVQQDGPPQQDAQTDTIPAVGCYGILINEFQTQGGTDNDEFIEIAGPVGGDLGNLKLVYRGSAATTDTLLYAFSTGNTIPVSGYVVIGSSGWDGGDGGVQAFGTYLASAARNLSPTGGGLALRSGVPDTGTIVDSVGYGTATNVFVQGSPTAAPPSGKSASRSPRCKSTGNNAADFSWTNPSPGK